MILILNKNANGNVELSVEQLQDLLEKAQNRVDEIYPLIVEPWKPKEGTHFQVVINDETETIPTGNL